MRPSLILILVAVTPACFPVLAHPTRVDQGFHVAVVATGGLVRDSAVYSDAPNGLVAPAVDVELSLHVRDTLRPKSTGLRVSAGAGSGGVGGSLYAELPRDWLGEIDAGIGYHRRIGYVKTHTAYVQFGRQTGARSWFVRNGATLMNRDNTSGRRLVWIPVLGTSNTSAKKDVILYVAGIVGAQVPVAYPCNDFDCSGSPNGYKRTYLVFGLYAAHVTR